MINVTNTLKSKYLQWCQEWRMVEFPATYKIISFSFTHLKLIPWHVQICWQNIRYFWKWILHMLLETEFNTQVKCFKLARRRTQLKVTLYNTRSLCAALRFCLPLFSWTRQLSFYSLASCLPETTTMSQNQPRIQWISRRDTVPGLQSCDCAKSQTGNLHEGSLFGSVWIPAGKQPLGFGLHIPREIR